MTKGIIIIICMFMLILMQSVVADDDSSEFEKIIYNRSMCAQFFETEIIGINITPLSPFPYETINIYNFDGEALGHMMIINNKIASGNCTLAPKPSYNVFVSDAYVLRNILDETFGIDTYVDAINNKELAIKGTDIIKRFKVGFITTFARFIAWFM